jgi:hypothetical protein
MGGTCKGLDYIVRKRKKYPYMLGELIIAKILALLHDPPWKSLTVTGNVVGEHNVKGALEGLCEHPCTIRIAFNKVSKRSKKQKIRRHEKEASRLASYLVGYLIRTIYESFGVDPFEIRKRISAEGTIRIVSRGDMLAASFDRIAVAEAERTFKEHQEQRRNKYLSTAVVRGLMNPFDPLVNATEPYALKDFRWKVINGLQSFARRYVDIARQLAGKLRRNGDPYIDLVDFLISFYHVFSVIYEPLWHEASGGTTWGPADTRVPHHSVFDHLYATASAVNLVVAHKGIGGINGDSGRSEDKSDVGVTGFLVYVGWRGLREWLRASRKLSDLWVASWLATALIWYAVKDLVWCLGPDILLVPGFRWNQFYLSLLRERLGDDLFEKTVGGVARDYYFWDGFPYYAWQPAEAILVLPLINSDSVLPRRCEFLKHILGAAKGSTRSSDEDCTSTVERLEEKAKLIRDYLVSRVSEAWRLVVRGVVEAVEEAARRGGDGVFGSGFACFVKRVAGLVEDVPPIEPIVEVVPLWAGVRRRDRGCWVEVCFYYGRRLNGCACRSVSSGDLSELLGASIRLPAEAIARLRSARDAAWFFAKLVYALGFYELMRRVEASRARVSLPGWARLVEEHWERLRRVEELAEKLLEARRERVWRSCSVCRHGVSVFWVPGRDTPEGVSEEYRKFALRLCGCSGGGCEDRCWRIWRPIFRPGERLCPYCLVKRLAGLPEVFRRVAEKLIGYPPAKEVRFPSTDDVATLATKLALLRLVKLAAWREGLEEGYSETERVAARALSEVREEIINILEGLGARVAELPHRSRLHEDLASALRQAGRKADELREKLGRLIEGRWWVPWRLYLELKTTYNTVGRDEKLVRALAGVVLLVDYEFYDLLDSRVGAEILKELHSLAGLVRSVARNLRWREEGEAKRLLLDVADALGSSRLYYSILMFDVDKAGWLRQGLIWKRGRIIAVEDYLKALVQSHIDTLQRLLCRNHKIADKAVRGVRFLRDYLGRHGEGWRSDPILAVARKAGSLLVTPSYHWALSNALGYTLLRSAIVSERLGGIPIYMGGDEGLIVLPAWLPWSLLPERTTEAYQREVMRAAECKTYCPVAENPGLTAAVLIRRIYWASSSARPGFHPVKRKGAGRTVYRIPALVSAGMSMGLRFSHYRDHLYAELAAVEALVEEAKRLGGDWLAVSMGRIQPSKPHEALKAVAGVKLSAQDLRLAARIAAEATIIAGMIMEGVASKGLLRAPMLQLREGAEGLQLVARELGAWKLAWNLVEDYVGRSARDAVRREALRMLNEMLKEEDVERLFSLIWAAVASSERATGR